MTRTRHGLQWVMGGMFLAAISLADASELSPQLSVSIRLEKSQFEAGEAIPVVFEIVNDGPSEYSVQASTEETGAWDGYSFTITDADGNPLSIPPRLPRPANWIGSWQSLRQHDRHTRKFFLNFWTYPPPPGHYQVVGSYTPSDKKHVWPVLRSESVAFEITLTTSMKLAVRIARLADQAEKGDEVAVDFLGFTGANEAIAPLLEAVTRDDARQQRRAANALTLVLERDMVRTAVFQQIENNGVTPILAQWLNVQAVPLAKVLPLYFRSLVADDPTARLGATTGLRLAAETTVGQSDYRAVLGKTLRRAATDSDTRVRIESLAGLVKLPDAENIAVLSQLARSDPSSRVRERAAAYLRDVRPADPSMPVRTAATATASPARIEATSGAGTP